VRVVRPTAPLIVLPFAVTVKGAPSACRLLRNRRPLTVTTLGKIIGTYQVGRAFLLDSDETLIKCGLSSDLARQPSCRPGRERCPRCASASASVRCAAELSRIGSRRRLRRRGPASAPGPALEGPPSARRATHRRNPETKVLNGQPAGAAASRLHRLPVVQVAATAPMAALPACRTHCTRRPALSDHRRYLTLPRTWGCRLGSASIGSAAPRSGPPCCPRGTRHRFNETRVRHPALRF
jgi:hypothetical protein